MQSPELTVAHQAAEAAGAVLARLFRGGITVTGKDPAAAHNLVSNADVEAEQAIVRVLRAAYPDHAILGEEEQKDDIHSSHLWVIDPLDGTTNFVHAIPHFAVSIAYYRDGVAQCGVVYNPIQNDRYEALRGAGARHDGRPISVASHQTLDQALIGVGFYYDRGRMMEATLDAICALFHRNIHGIRRFGTASLDLAQVACGRYGAYLEYELSPWDFAAGWLIVEEAGGKVTDCGGAPLELRKTSLLASNGALHEAVLEIAKQHVIESK